MATPRQIEANKKNAEKSTGPKTEEGKATSRGNAVKHGMSGEGIAILPVDLVKKEERLNAWRRSYQAEIDNAGDDGEYLYEQIVLNSLRIQEAQRREMNIHQSVRLRALNSWQDDRTVLAQSIAEKLIKAQSPSLIVARLRTFLQGIEWLILQWAFLINALENGKTLSEEEAGMFDSLLGLPKMFRDPIEDEEIPTLLGLARDKLANLESLLEGAKEIDDFERGIAIENGFTVALSKEEKLNRRYEDLAQRRFLWARKQLKGTDPQGVSTPQAASVPQAPPAPVEPPAEEEVDPDSLDDDAFEEWYRNRYLSDTPARNEADATLGNMEEGLTTNGSQEGAGFVRVA